MGGKVRLDLDGRVAVITNDNAGKHNAFDDAMDAELFEIFDELVARSASGEVGAVVWRGEGKSFSSGRDVAAVKSMQVDMTHHELMQHVNRGTRRIFDIQAPIVVAAHGWTIGASFQRALLCDLRIAAEGTRFLLPEMGYGLIPDLGGVARLYQICGHGVAGDMVLTGRAMQAEEALGHGVVSRVVAHERLDDTAHEMATTIAVAPTATVKMARRVLSKLATPQVVASMADEMVAQTIINQSDDLAEMRRARREEREPVYRGA